MSAILDMISASTRKRVEAAKSNIPLLKMRQMAEEMGDSKDFPFENALKKEGLSFICECKKASPSKGIIAEDFPYVQIAQEYESAGADCISVLTEPVWFMGNNRYLKEISSSVKIPCLRKDFTVDEYMIWEAKTLGAKAVLLICAILDRQQINEYLDIAHSLGLSAIVETHDESEMETAIDAGAHIIGVNNRNLKDFSVDIENSRRLKSMAPKDTIFVAESGIKTREDVAALEECGVSAVLIGETLMKAKDKKAMLNHLKGVSV